MLVTCPECTLPLDEWELAYEKCERRQECSLSHTHADLHLFPGQLHLINTTFFLESLI